MNKNKLEFLAGACYWIQVSFLYRFGKTLSMQPGFHNFQKMSALNCSLYVLKTLLSFRLLFL